VILNSILGPLTLLSFALTLWQWLVARRFPLHQRAPAHAFQPAVTLLKPVKGCDEATEDCLRSWFAQDYTGRLQILFGVASADDPVCQIANKLIKEFPAIDAQLIVCGPLLGANAKVSKLAELERLAKHEVLIISDADVRVPPDLLANIVEPLREAVSAFASTFRPLPLDLRPSLCGLVTCFYRLANIKTLAMQWEGVAINADFWSQVLQAQSLKPIDFALGAVMAMPRKQLQEIGGFTAIVDCLADDYQLGHRIARCGHRIVISPVVVECWSAPMGWKAVWKHQLRWARTIRVCQPVPYFFSILSNATLWPLVWAVASPSRLSLVIAVLCLIIRIATALHLQSKLSGPGNTAQVSASTVSSWWLIPLKDLLQAAVWLLAFTGNRIEWRGEQMRLHRDGTLKKLNK
jgi:ceramide glucosyltransferase